MKIRILFFALLAAALLVSCGRTPKSGKPGSSGKTLEVLVVADNNVYSGYIKPTIDTLFRAPQEGLMGNEPMFDIVNIPLSSFRNTEMFRVHRNIILCEVKPEHPNKVYNYVDKYSSPQVVFEFLASSGSSLDSMLRRYAPTIIATMHNADYRRIIKAFNGIKGYELMESVKKRFGFSLVFSNEFAEANPLNPTDDFAWIRKEAKDFGIGVLVNVQPYVSSKQFAEESILDNLDTIMSKHVPASADSSYMGIERRVPAITKVVKVDAFPEASFAGSPYIVETRGLWRAFGDFMGGPYVSYTLLSPDSAQLISLTGYVYCPRYDKRDYLMQVDGICHSISF